MNERDITFIHRHSGMDGEMERHALQYYILGMVYGTDRASRLGKDASLFIVHQFSLWSF
jgi:hypothetical protein